MTKSDLFNLRQDQIYEFKFYHGRIAIGILHGFNNEVFFIPYSALNKNGSLKTQEEIKKLGEHVNIETISSYKSIAPVDIDKNGSYIDFKDFHQAKKLVILGAGASFDFSSDSTIEKFSKPPLVNDLFSHWNNQQIIRSYPGALNLSHTIRVTSDIEDYFQKRWKHIEENNDRVTLAKIINVQYYLHELFMQISGWSQNIELNNFDILVNALHEYTVRKKEIVPIVSFNYDLLTEFALMRSIGYEFNSIDDYVTLDNRRILLFKPHGSCNWIRYFYEEFIPPSTSADMRFPNQVAHWLMQKQLGYPEILENLYEEISIKNQWGIDTTNHEALTQYYPQLLIPFKSKDEFVMPSKHQQILDFFLDGIKEILIIGWKGTEVTFNSLLKRKLGGKNIQITIVNGNGEFGQQTFDNLFKYLPGSIPNIAHETFSSFSKKIANGNVRFFD